MSGKIGGDACRDKHKDDPDYYKRLGAKGGNTTKRRKGREHFQRIGSIGGSRTAVEQGPGFYQKIGSKGGQETKKLVAEAMEARRLREEAEGGE